ncbi:MAG: hypothetical protein SFY68_11860, partial [Candidatus Sumerlaeia bacterium]|nr:hypothetical protein [Candidatus Sumerlaeia bacterium]
MKHNFKKLSISLMATALLVIASSAPAAITSVFDTVTGGLSISTDAAENVSIVVDSGLIKINGSNPLVGGLNTDVPTTGIVSISFLGSADVDSLDLSTLQVTSFPVLNSVILNTAGGNDTILGGGLVESIIPGPGADTVNAGAGNDTITWNNGDGTDVVDGGQGTDVQVVNGASGGTGDVFTLAASGANAFFERTNFGLFSVTTSAVETF